MKNQENLIGKREVVKVYGIEIPDYLRCYDHSVATSTGSIPFDESNCTDCRYLNYCDDGKIHYMPIKND